MRTDHVAKDECFIRRSRHARTEIKAAEPIPKRKNAVRFLFKEIENGCTF